MLLKEEIKLNSQLSTEIKKLSQENLARTVELEKSSKIGDLIKQALLRPVCEFIERPKKNVRGNLTEIGFQLASANLKKQMSSEEKVLCLKASGIIEGVHAGSLIVDDIEDRSHFRRGKPTLHTTYGTAVALNAGNWLYFWPMKKIRELEIDEAKELQIYRLFHETFLRAHYGQALDVGTAIDRLSQDQVRDVCMATLELKSGSLMALALQFGAILAGITPEQQSILDHFGHRLGIVLQMLDDIHNFSLQVDSHSGMSKRHEDLYLRRPTWIWAVAAQNYSAKSYQEFIRAVHLLPKEEALNQWINSSGIVPLAQKSVQDELKNALKKLRHSLGSQETLSPLQEKAFMNLNFLVSNLVKAYETTK